jgi:hypothetical protein
LLAISEVKFLIGSLKTMLAAIAVGSFANDGAAVSLELAPSASFR